MAKKKKVGVFRADKAVRSMAREAIGTPPPTRAVPVKKKSSKEKYKPKLQDLLQGE
jgi:hypothetical protein